MPDSNPSISQQRQSSSGGVPEPLLQADTFVRSASNLATGGLADDAEAAMDASFDRSPGDWLARYKAALQNQLARDAYDSSHRRLAVALGNGLGAVLLADGAFIAGARGSAALPSVAKGQLGEGLSVAKTILKGDRPTGFHVWTKLNNGKWTVVDQTTSKGINVEAKFGRRPLRPNQLYAQQQFGPAYRVDRWLPDHVGAMTAPLGPAVGGLLSWGMHYLNSPHQDTPAPQAPPENTTPDDIDGGSQYGRWQDDFGDPTMN
jgi:hypothetical protein